MGMSNTLRICFGFFFILVKEFLCDPPGPYGKCCDENSREINRENEFPCDPPGPGICCDDCSADEFPCDPPGPPGICCDDCSADGAVIGGVVGGGAILVIIIVIVIVVLVIKRKKTKNTKPKNEDYYITENELYNVRNSSIKSTNENTYDTCDEIEAANRTRESRVYAEVDTNKNTPNENTKTPHTVDENEYNHLNDLKGPVSTGNIYSSTGKRESESDANIYNSTHQGTLGNASSGSRDDNIYNTSNES